MTLFRKKDGSTPTDNSDELPENAAGDEAVFDETADGLTAPSRPEMKSGGSRKNLLVLLVLLLIAGGGAFYFLTAEDETYVAAVDQAAVPADPAPADVSTTTTVTETTVTTETAPVDGTMPVDPALAAEAPESDPMAAMPPMPEPPAADPTVQTITQTVTTVETPSDAMPQVPQPPGTTTTTTESVSVTSTAAQESAATSEAAGQGDDLPLPQSEEAIALPVGAVTPTAGAVATVTTTETTTTTTTAQPTDGELAIINNATTLDKMPAPQGAANDMMADLASQDAMIRPLPKQYLVVHKDNNSGELNTRLTTARLALSQDRSQAALQIFNELYQDYPKDKRVLMGRAVALQKLGQNGEALLVYEELLNRDPKNLEALTNMLGLLKKENPSLAVEKLIELREAYPFNADVTAQLGIAYGGSGEYDEALKYLDMAEALKPGNALVLYNKGVLLDKMGRSVEAANIYRGLVRLSADGNLDQSLPIDVIKRRLAVMR